MPKWEYCILHADYWLIKVCYLTPAGVDTETVAEKKGVMSSGFDEEELRTLLGQALAKLGTEGWEAFATHVRGNVYERFLGVQTKIENVMVVWLKRPLAEE